MWVGTQLISLDNSQILYTPKNSEAVYMSVYKVPPNQSHTCCSSHGGVITSWRDKELARGIFPLCLSTCSSLLD